MRCLVLCTSKRRSSFVDIGVVANAEVPIKEAELPQVPEELLRVVLENCVIWTTALLRNECKVTPNSSKCIWHTFRRASVKTVITHEVCFRAS